MRVTLSQLRDIGRSGVRWRPPDPKSKPVVPSAVRRKAIRTYHDESLADALAYLDGRHPNGARGLSGTFGPKGKRAKQGRRTRDGFGRYVKLDRRDGRPAAELMLKEDVEIGSHLVQVTADVVVFADDGYSGRILNWDRTGVDGEVVDVLGLPGALLLDQELGEDTCVDIEIWDLERGEKWLVNREAAFSQLKKLAHLLDRVEAAVSS